MRFTVGPRVLAITTILTGLTIGLVTRADDRPPPFQGTWSSADDLRRVTFTPTQDPGRVEVSGALSRDGARTFAAEGVLEGGVLRLVRPAELSGRTGLAGLLAGAQGRADLFTATFERQDDGRIRCEYRVNDAAGTALLEVAGTGWKERPLGWKQAGSPEDEARLRELWEAEARVFTELEARVKGIQDKVAKGGPLQRGFHNKGFGMRAELRVLADIPADLQVGLFQPGRTYQAVARFSNAGPKAGKDSAPDQRGLALRVWTGRAIPLLSGVTADAQDFLTTNSDITARDPVQFLDFADLTAADGVVDALAVKERAKAKYGLKEFLHIAGVLTGGLGSPASMTDEQLWSSRAPIQWGRLAVKFALVPASTPAPYGGGGDDGLLGRLLTSNHLRDDLRDRLKTGPVVLDFCVQRFASEATTPIEDGSVRWTTPFERVAQLVIPQQELDESEARALASEIERLAFNPWNCTEEFRPLGSLMRSRRGVYQKSAEHRSACPFGFGR